MDPNNNRPAFATLTDEYLRLERQLKLGGGREKIEKIHKQGKLTARERIDLLLDPNTFSQEIGLLVAYDEYNGQAPAAAVVTIVGKVNGRECVVVANDATIKAGAWYPETIKKILRAQEIAMRNRVPIIYLVDSAGVNLPYQGGVFPGQYGAARIFYYNSIMRRYLEGAADRGGNGNVRRRRSIFAGADRRDLDGRGNVVHGPRRSEPRQRRDRPDDRQRNPRRSDDPQRDFRRRALPHKRRKGMYREDPRTRHGTARPKSQSQVSTVAPVPAIRIRRATTLRHPARRPSCAVRHACRARHVSRCGTFDEFQADFAQEMICGTARIGGILVGVIANSRGMSKGKSGQPPRFGGIVYTESAEKTAYFIENCDRHRTPLLFVQDVSGFMVGAEAEHSGIIRAGARFVEAMATATVPKIVLTINHASGAGYYAMAGQGFDPDFIFTLPTGRMGVMEGDSAVQAIFGTQLEKLKKKANEPDEALKGRNGKGPRNLRP